MFDSFKLTPSSILKEEGYSLEEIRSYHKKERKHIRTLKAQVGMGMAMIGLNLLVPTGAAVLLVPMGIWEIYKAFKDDIVIYP